MSKPTHLYKIYHKITAVEDGDTEEIFGTNELKIRNWNNDSYRFYNEFNDTVTIKKENMNGVFMQYHLDKATPYIEAYMITLDEEFYNICLGKEELKENEKEDFENFKKELKAVADKALVNYVDQMKRVMGQIKNVEEQVVETV